MGDLKSRKAACKYNRGISPIYPLPGRKIRFSITNNRLCSRRHQRTWSCPVQLKGVPSNSITDSSGNKVNPFSKRAKFVTKPLHIPAAKFAQTQPVMIDAAFNNGEINPSSEKARGMVSRTSFDRLRGGFNCKEWASLSNSQGHDLRGKSRPISLSFGSVS